MIGALIPQAQAAVSAAAAAKNISAGLASYFNQEKSTRTLLAKDIGGFEFSYIGEERVEAETEITDHYTENNTFIQDHAALRPQIVTCRGFVAELSQTARAAQGLFGLGVLPSVLGPILPYVGQYRPGAAAVVANVANVAMTVDQQLNQAAAVGKSVMKLFGAQAQTKIQEAFDRLDSLRRQQYTFDVVTPFATFSGMLIQRITLISPEQTRGWADITVTLKEIRYVPTESGPNFANGRLDQTLRQLGVTRGTAMPMSKLNGFTSGSRVFP
jgi:hypothetical protein